MFGVKLETMKDYKRKFFGDPLKRPSGYYWVKVYGRWKIGYHYLAHGLDGCEFWDAWEIMNETPKREIGFIEEDLDQVIEKRIKPPKGFKYKGLPAGIIEK